jgi:chlorobactene glucosyltransferase
VTPIALAILGVYGIVLAAWVALHVLLFFYSPRRYFLGRRALDPGAAPPLVSVLLAARDERGNIGDCVRSILASTYPCFELIVIDDRSTDGTAREAAEAAGHDPRVRLLSVDALPDGWTGKMHAVRLGLTQARGTLILIIDADTRHAPETLSSAVALQQEKHIDLLSLLPRFDHASRLSRFVQPVIGALLFFWKPLPWVNSRRRTHVAMAWGGFLLMRREALEANGGLEAVGSRFAADIALAARFKQAGGRVRLLHAPELVSTFLYDSPRAMVAGWSRLLRLTADNRASWLAGSLAAIALFCLSAYAAIGLGLALGLEGVFPRLLVAMGVAHLALQVGLLGRFYRIGRTGVLYALGHPLALAFACHVHIRAMRQCRGRSLTWRGQTYALRGDGPAAAAPAPHGPGGRSAAGGGPTHEPDRPVRR